MEITSILKISDNFWLKDDYLRGMVGDEDKESYLEVANDHRLARDVLKKA